MFDRLELPLSDAFLSPFFPTDCRSSSESEEAFLGMEAEDKGMAVTAVVVAVMVFVNAEALRDGIISGAAGARRMFEVGFESRLSHRVVAGDMLCFPRWLCTGWKAD